MLWFIARSAGLIDEFVALRPSNARLHQNGFFMSFSTTGNQLTEDGFKALMLALPRCVSLTTLDLSGESWSALVQFVFLPITADSPYYDHDCRHDQTILAFLLLLIDNEFDSAASLRQIFRCGRIRNLNLSGWFTIF